MDYKINYHNIIEESIVDGPGLRFVLFTQGCPHHCPGCHNPQTHPFTVKNLVSATDIFNQYRENPLLTGITFSGGEPFCQASALAALANMIKSAGGNVVTYTGYYYEELKNMAISDPGIGELLLATDYLIDGPFVEEEKSLTLLFRGSSNQRIWDLKQGCVISFEE